MQAGVLADTRHSVVAEDTAAATAAMAAGQNADSDRRGRYMAGMLPLGATSHGDQMQIPPVPEQDVTAASPDYPQGDQPGA